MIVWFLNKLIITFKMDQLLVDIKTYMLKLIAKHFVRLQKKAPRQNRSSGLSPKTSMFVLMQINYQKPQYYRYTNVIKLLFFVFIVIINDFDMFVNYMLINVFNSEQLQFTS